MKRIYQYREAFCLMKYDSQDGLVTEYIWNSRDGVTPFCVWSEDGKTMLSHVDRTRDIRVPDFAPPPGSRYFVSVTAEEARERAESSADRVINQNGGILPTYYFNREHLVLGLLTEYMVGETPIIKVAQ
jgi:hypothetical protein